MSADNWATCPRCLARARQEKARLLNESEATYGVLPVEEYLELRRVAESFSTDPDDFNTLREDYELWMDTEGSFQVHYSAVCTQRLGVSCGFGFKFKHDEKVPVGE